MLKKGILIKVARGVKNDSSEYVLRILAASDFLVFDTSLAENKTLHRKIC